MPEGVRTYPRWDGPLKTGSAIPIVAGQEIRRAMNNFWTRTALLLVLAYAVVYLGSLYTLSQSRGDAVHTMTDFLKYANIFRWGGLIVAAAMAGPSLLEDTRRGALELYLSRAVNRAEYIWGKILATLGLTTLAVVAPPYLYWIMSFFFFKNHPIEWPFVPASILLYGLLWSSLVVGVGMGLSAVSKSSRAATLLLFGGFAAADIILGNLFQALTDEGNWKILSPFSAIEQQTSWLFQVPAAFDFPYWWGLLEWALLTILGWSLVVWKRPRVTGE